MNEKVTEARKVVDTFYAENEDIIKKFTKYKEE